MTDNLVQLFHALPSPVKSLAASLWGYYLRSWRYGTKTEQLVGEALDRDHWDSKRWKNWQEVQLSYVLNRAATRVPYYREQWAARRRKGDLASSEYLENWPLLEKDSVRRYGHAFVADDCNRRLMFHEHTSGTTGTPLNLWWSHSTVQGWYALFEARWRRWYNVSRKDRWAILGGQLIASTAARRPPFWVWNAAFNQLYMSSYHLALDLIPHYLEALKKYRITYLFGYPSSLYFIAQEVLRSATKDLNMNVVITNAEPLFEYQRQAISDAFQCPVRNTYGMAEIVTAASECEDRCLHLWPEVGYVEVFENSLPVDSGTSGDLVCTSLLNADMPLIRYRVGDRGALGRSDVTCTCGRGLPTLSAVEGRCDDVLYSFDGHRIGRLDPVFKVGLPIREAQIIQEALARIRVRYVPTPEFSREAERSIVDRLRARMGPVEVVLEPVNEVPRTSNGKFRAVLCNITPGERPVTP